ncbi:Multidrug resistance protein MdtG [Austwickia sp. TVS 96-490-7B]|nr:Multidrug resistance protein MdtG [Austwickia sp. TVS 96-490-7B]
MLIRSSLMICMAYALCAYSTNVSSLFASRCLAGVASGFVPVASSALAQISNPETRNRDLSWITSFRTAGALSGPALGAVLVWRTNSFRLAFLASALLSLITLGAALIAPNVKAEPELQSAEPQARQSFSTLVWIPISVIFTLTIFSMLIGTWLPLTLSRISGAISAAPVLATISTAAALATMMLAPLWGRLADANKTGAVLLATLIAPIPLTLALNLTGTPLAIGLVIVAIAIVGVDSIGLLSGEATKRLPDQDIAPFFGWSNTATQFGNALGVGLAPILMEYSHALPIAASVALDVISVILIIAMLRGAKG